MAPSALTPLWKDGVSTPSFPALQEDLSCDVCVVGAGIAGLTTAYLLAKEGKDVVVIDDGPIAGGETERTTAHIVSALDDRYFWLEEVHGPERTRLAAQSHATAIDFIEEVVKAEQINCDFQRVSGYLFLRKDEPVENLQKELDAIHRTGLSDVSFQGPLLFGTNDVGPAIHFPRQGQFHILRYMSGLAKAAEKHGARIFLQTHAAKLEGGHVCQVTVESGYTINSKSIVIATNAPVHDNVQVYARQAAYRTFVITARIPKGAVQKALYWDTSRPDGAYHYIRLDDDPHGDGELITIGGEDHKTGQQNDGELRFANLESWARAHIPQMQDIVYRWSGQVMETDDGLALIGKLPGLESNLYIATGDSGNGMTHGTIAGLLLTEQLFGREHPWIDLYSPSRVRPRAAKEFISENASTAKAMIKGWLGKGASDHEMKPNTGKVVRKGITKIALYCDSKGDVHTRSAVCPHKGCIVAWNGTEQSWDCPCHGSRFDAYGKVLNGPSMSDLAKIEE